MRARASHGRLLHGAFGDRDEVLSHERRPSTTTLSLCEREMVVRMVLEQAGAIRASVKLFARVCSHVRQ